MARSQEESLIEQVPQYTLNHFDDGRDEKISLVVLLPGVESASDLNVEVAPYSVLVHVPGRYRLALALDTEVQDEPEFLKFVKKKSTLKAQFIVKPVERTQKPATTQAVPSAAAPAAQGPHPDGSGTAQEPEHSNGDRQATDGTTDLGGVSGGVAGGGSGAASSSTGPAAKGVAGSAPSRPAVHSSFYDDLVVKPKKAAQKRRQAGGVKGGAGGAAETGVEEELLEERLRSLMQDGPGSLNAARQAAAPSSSTQAGKAGASPPQQQRSLKQPGAQLASHPGLSTDAGSSSTPAAGARAKAGTGVKEAGGKQHGQQRVADGNAGVTASGARELVPDATADSGQAGGSGGAPAVAGEGNGVPSHVSGSEQGGNLPAGLGGGQEGKQESAAGESTLGDTGGPGRTFGSPNVREGTEERGGGATAGQHGAGASGADAPPTAAPAQQQQQHQQATQQKRKKGAAAAASARPAAGGGSAAAAQSAAQPVPQAPGQQQAKRQGRATGRQSAPGGTVHGQGGSHSRQGGQHGKQGGQGKAGAAADKGQEHEDEEEEEEEEGPAWHSVEGIQASAAGILDHIKAYPQSASGTFWLLQLLYQVLGLCIGGCLAHVALTCAAWAPWAVGFVSRRRAKRLQAALDQSVPHKVAVGVAVAALVVLFVWTAVTLAVSFTVVLLQLAIWLLKGILWEPQPVLALILAVAILFTLKPYHPHLFITRRLWTVPLMLYGAGSHWWCVASLPVWALLHRLSGAGWQSSLAVPLAMWCLRELAWYFAVPAVVVVGMGWFAALALAVSMAEWAAGGSSSGAKSGSYGSGSWRGGDHGAWFGSARGRDEVPEGATGEVARVLQSHDLYEVLQVPRDADEEAVRRAKKLKSLATHPDKLGTAVGAKEAFQRVTQAADVLSDPAKRQQYDRQLHLEESGGGSAGVGAGMGMGSGAAADGTPPLYFPCNTCGGRHAVSVTNREQASARFCAQHNTQHPASHGDCWLERRGRISLLARTRAYMCLYGVVLDMTEYADCNGMLRNMEPNTCDPPYQFGFEAEAPAAPGSAARTNNKKKGKRR